MFSTQRSLLYYPTTKSLIDLRAEVEHSLPWDIHLLKYPEASHLWGNERYTCEIRFGK